MPEALTRRSDSKQSRSHCERKVCPPSCMFRNSSASQGPRRHAGEPAELAGQVGLVAIPGVGRDRGQVYPAVPPRRCRDPGRGVLESAVVCVSRTQIPLPVSAHECPASATIDADPDNTLATVFATATAQFAPSAISTVRVLSPDSTDGAIWSRSCSGFTPPPRCRSDSWCSRRVQHCRHGLIIDVPRVAPFKSAPSANVLAKPPKGNSLDAPTNRFTP